ncbi:MAG TPA: AbrB/MazE/SpoVT family DNA-binding domain-containing protein [Acetobacteraceae bacterium]|jgi:AbrB family looped-hinge helix DNA binding protein
MDATVTAKGQITLPKSARQHLGLQAGDRVRVFLHPDGGVVLLPVLPASALRGMLKPRCGPVTIDDMTEAVAAGAVARFRGSQQ